MPGDDVLALRVGKELAVERLLAGRRVARERDAGRRGLAPVAEDHRLDVDGGAPVVGDVVEPAVGLRALVVPGPEDRADRAPELLARVVRESRAPVCCRTISSYRAHDLSADPPPSAPRPTPTPSLLAPRVRTSSNSCRGTSQDDVAVHLEEPAAAVEREALARQRRRGPATVARRQAEVQDRVHHSGHRGARARAHRDEQRVRRVAEALRRRRSRACASACSTSARTPSRLARPREVGADRRLDREARAAPGSRAPSSRPGPTPLPPRRLLAEARALGHAVAEEEDAFHLFLLHHDFGKVRDPREFSAESTPSSASRFRRRSSSGQLTSTSTKKRSSDGAIEAIVSIASR